MHRLLYKAKLLTICTAVFAGLIVLLSNTSIGATSSKEAVISATDNTEIKIPFDEFFLEDITGWGIRVTAGNYYNADHSLSDLGLEITEIPSELSRKLSFNPQIKLSFDSSKFESFIEQVKSQIHSDKIDNSLNILNGSITIRPGTKGVELVRNDYKNLLISNLTNARNQLKLEVKETEIENTSDLIESKDFLTKLSKIDIWIRFLDSGIKIPGEELLEVIKINNQQNLSINEEKLKEYLVEKMSSYEANSEVQLEEYGYKNFTAIDTKPNYDRLTKQISEIILTREVEDDLRIYTEINQFPATEGEYSSRYNEVDISQQRMYVWRDGELSKTYIISSGDHDLTPYGIFKIKNKAPRAWSEIYEKWMPYWMAFTYPPGLDGWVGFHELTYWYDEYGNKVLEDESRLGQRVSGGCVRLGRGEAEEFYNMSEVGDDVLIHE